MQGRKYLRALCGIFLSLNFLGVVHAAEKPLTASKRRVLIIPFDNVQSNKNFDWMSESISDNMKAEMEKAKRFDVMDVTLLKRVTANIDYTNLTAEDATQLARTLNCEAALIGRYFIARRAGKERIIIQTEGVDTLSGKSVFTSSLAADAGGNLFNSVQNLAESAAAELGEKLPPFDPTSVKRSGKFERLLYRLDHPPKGFFDSFEVSHFALVPEFDIDVYDYEVNTDIVGEARKREFTYDYFPWGKVFKPEVATEGMACTPKQVCTIEKDRSVLTLSHNGKSYRVRFNHTEPPASVSGRMWLAASYPMMRSFSLAGQTNPQTLTANGSLPFDVMKGFVGGEAGFSPARWQLPLKIKWAGIGQFYGATGNAPQYEAGYGGAVKVSMFSFGLGLRLDRTFYIRNWWGVAPFVAVVEHYQRMTVSFSDTAISAWAFAPEVGINQSFRILKEANWRILLSVAGGSFLYKSQNLSYARVGLGVEYAIR